VLWVHQRTPVIPREARPVPVLTGYGLARQQTPRNATQLQIRVARTYIHSGQMPPGWKDQPAAPAHAARSHRPRSLSLSADDPAP
jgi:hypothetical protein